MLWNVFSSDKELKYTLEEAKYYQLQGLVELLSKPKEDSVPKSEKEYTFIRGSFDGKSYSRQDSINNQFSVKLSEGWAPENISCDKGYCYIIMSRMKEAQNPRG